jgi:hypothetical protein
MVVSIHPMKKKSSLLMLLACSLAPFASAQNLYTAQDGDGAGNLYRLALDGTPTLVGPLLDSSNHTFSITGLAQFGNGPMYGVTANLSPTSPRSLVTVDLNTARVTVVGSLALNSPQSPVNDIVFLQNGTLFGYAARVGKYVTINTTTGAATLLGSPQGVPESLAVSPVALTFTTVSGGGGGGGEQLNLASPKSVATQTTIPAGTVFAARNGSCGELDTVKPANGAVTPLTTLSSNNCSFSISGLRFASNGTLYTLLSVQSDPFLATINTSGAVTTIGNGSVPSQVGSLAFGVPVAPPTSVPFVSSPVLLAMTLGLLMLGLLQFRRMQRA